VRYELGFYIPEDSIHHSHRRENLLETGKVGSLPFRFVPLREHLLLTECHYLKHDLCKLTGWHHVSEHIQGSNTYVKTQANEMFVLFIRLKN
jgi:hypothetical protein